MSGPGLDFAGVRARHSLVEVAARYLPDLKKQGSEYVCRCPLHNDSDPSFTIWRGRDGIERFHCFPCQSHGDVIDFMREMESIDAPEAVRRLDGGTLPMPNTREPRTLPPDASDCWEPIVPVPADAAPLDLKRVFNPKAAEDQAGRRRYKDYARSATHRAEWRDHTGALWGYVVRLEFDGKKYPVTVTWCVGPGGERLWAAKRPAGPYPLVGADGLGARTKAPVLVVEGEKKREAIAAKLPAFVVVSLYGGAGGIAALDLSPLVGRNVTLWPDADAPGNRAMHDLGVRLIGDV